MRVLHVTEASASGTLGVVTALAAAQVAAGHEVALAHGTRPETPGDLRRRVAADVELVALDWRRRTLPAQLSAARGLRRFARAWSPDLIHLHSSFAGTLGAAALGGAPKVYTPHGYAFARRPRGGGLALVAYRAAERWVARRCDAIAAVSQAEAQLAREVLGAPHVHVVPNGVPELDAPMAARRPRSRPLVVCSGRIGPARRPDASARILSAVADLAEVRWIGDGPADEARPLRQAGIPVTGWLDRGRALEALAEATVLLHFSAWDGAPLVVLEALARDVVVVASDIPANREMLGPEQVRAGEAGVIALVRAVLTDDALRESLLAGQRERAAGRGAAAMSRRHADVYAAVLAARRDRALGAPATRNIGGPWS